MLGASCVVIRSTAGAARIHPEQLVRLRLAADGEAAAGGAGKAGLQSLADSTIVVDRRQVGVGGLLRPGTGSNASPRRRRSGRTPERACAKAPASKYARPRIEAAAIQVSREAVGFEEFDPALACARLLQRDAGLDHLRVGARLGLQLGGQAGHQRAGPRGVARLDERSRCGLRKRHLHGLAAPQAPFQPPLPLVRPSLQEPRVGQRDGLAAALSAFLDFRSSDSCSRRRTASENRPSKIARSPRPEAPRKRRARRWPPASGRSASRRAAGPGPSCANASASVAYASGPSNRSAPLRSAVGSRRRSWRTARGCRGRWRAIGQQVHDLPHLVDRALQASRS